MIKEFGLVLAVSLTSYLYADSEPIDNIDAELRSLSYDLEEEDLGDDLLDYDEAADPTPKTKETGFKKKKTVTAGTKKTQNRNNFRNVFKIAGGNNQGNYNDNDVYGEAEAVAAKAVGVTGKENRKYRKGTKTRGFHRVHHKDEYKKDKVIYEDDETSGEIKKVGAKGTGFKIGAGAGFAKGHVNHNHKRGTFGKRGFSDKGLEERELTGYSNSQGFDGSFAVRK